MIRYFGFSGLLILGLALAFTLGGWAGDPPLKKLNPEAGDEGKSPPKPGNGEKELELPKDPPKIDPPTKPLKKEEAEDPKEIIARVTKNMETSEDQLKKGKTGSDTQTTQKKIIEDLEKLINQQKKADSDSENQKPKQSKIQKSGSGDGQKNQPDKQPKPGEKNGKDGDNQNQPKPGGPSEKPKQGGKDDKDKNDKTADNTVSNLVKDIWGHLPKGKRKEMDAYSHEQFMPQYEQLLRQYYQNIATQGKKKD